MKSAFYDITGTKPLPPGDGPGLLPFKYQHATIDFLALLSGTRDNENVKQKRPPEGGDAYVFKVRIKAEDYALKVVSPVISLFGYNFLCLQ